MEIDGVAVPSTDIRSGVRSCTTCSKAKAKCVRLPNQQVCERCTRLRKECHLREPVLRKRKAVKQTRAAQLEKLEDKIEHLVNALSTSQAAQKRLQSEYGQLSPRTSNGEGTSGPCANDVLNSICHHMDEAENSEATPGSGGPSPSPLTERNHSSLSRTASQVGTSDYSSLGVSMSEAEILLDRYRRLMAPACPFVIITPDCTAQQLYSKKPLLLHAIVTVAYFHDLPKQQVMIKQWMRDVSERVLMNNEKTLGILQGILVLVAWYHPHVFWGQQVTNLLHLAIAITIDMGIDRPPGQCQDFKAATTKAMHGNSLALRVPSLDENRALAGVFYLTSTLASSFKKIDALKYSKYLEDTLNGLLQAAEYESDQFLVQMVRLQHVAEETHTTEVPAAPMQVYAKAFKADLERLRQNDPCKEPNVFLQMQYLAVEILIWELSLNELSESKVKPLRAHLDDLYRCIMAIKAFVDVYFSIPVNCYLTMPFSAFGHFAHAFIALARLASLEVEGWDMRTMTDKINFSNVIEEAAVRFDNACKSSPDGLQVNNEAFGKWAHRVRWMKQVFEAKFVQQEYSDRGSGALRERQDAVKVLFRPPEGFTAETVAAAPGAQQPTPPDDILSGDFFNYLDENFWNSFAGDFELGYPEMAV